MWGYILGVSQNIVAAFLAVAAHHVTMVRPMMRRQHDETVKAVQETPTAPTR
jgi:hypothetical protein